jgi:hypothetical protein
MAVRSGKMPTTLSCARGLRSNCGSRPTRGQRGRGHAMSNLLYPSVLGPGLEDKVLAVHELAAALGNAVRNRGGRAGGGPLGLPPESWKLPLCGPGRMAAIFSYSSGGSKTAEPCRRGGGRNRGTRRSQRCGPLGVRNHLRCGLIHRCQPTFPSVTHFACPPIESEPIHRVGRPRRASVKGTEILTGVLEATVRDPFQVGPRRQAD